MRKIHLFLLIGFTVLFAACSSKSDNVVLNYTTDKTLGIARYNLNNFVEKVSPEKLLQEKPNLDKELTMLLQLASKPSEAGIDITKPLYVIVDPGKKAYSPQVNILFSLTDKTKFQEKMSSIIKETVKIDEKDYIYIKEELVGSYKDGLAVFCIEEPKRSYSYDDDGNRNKASMNTPEKLDAFWARKGDAKASIKEQVSKALTDKKDVAAWMNIESVALYVSAGYIESLAVFKLLKDAGISANFNFDNGKFELESSTYFNADMKSILNKYYAKNSVNYDLVKYVDIDSASTYSFSYISLDLVKYIIKESGFETKINLELQELETNLDEITSLLTGDFAIANFKPTSNDYYYDNKAAAVIGFNKDKRSLIDKFVEIFEMETPGFAIGENEILVSSDSTIIAQFTNKVAAKNAKLNKVSGVNSYTWTDANDLYRNYFYASKSDVDDQMPIKVVDMVSEAKVTDGDLYGKFTVNFDKKDQNVIYYLFRYE